MSSRAIGLAYDEVELNIQLSPAIQNQYYLGDNNAPTTAKHDSLARSRFGSIGRIRGGFSLVGAGIGNGGKLGGDKVSGGFGSYIA